MLRFLSVENFALIERLEIEFHPGLTLITGETGSGKSILVDAVGLLTGERASQEMVREGFDKARVEGIFTLPPDHPAHGLLAQAGLSAEESEVVIRREISRTGNNKLFINGALSTQGLLAELGALLADIHGQHDQQLLLQPRTHLDFLDASGKNDQFLEELAALYEQLRDLRERLAHIQASERDRLQKIDTLRYQIGDIDALQLQPGLDRALEGERAFLSTAEKRLQCSEGAYQRLYEKDESVLSLINIAEKDISVLATLDPAFEPVAARLRDTRYQLEEVAYLLRDYAAGIEFNQARLEDVEDHLARIHKARRKYGDSVDEILAYRERAGRELEDLLRSEHQTEELGRQAAATEALYYQKARRLSEKRRADIEALCRAVEKELAFLSMEHAVFQVTLKTSDSIATEKGIDEAEFLISANPGEEPRPLAKIASGGELSRIILALRSVLTLEKYPKTLVFDEIDSGIGGRVASNIGVRLSRLAASHQVFCVTHLPQIALQADHHYQLQKIRSGNRTIVEASPLESEERVRELARMLAGETVTAQTVQHARELLRSRTPRGAPG